MNQNEPPNLGPGANNPKKIRDRKSKEKRRDEKVKKKKK
jgi:hypothetical protein